MGSLIDFCWIIFQLLIGYNLVLPLILYVLYLLFPYKNKIGNGFISKEADYAIIVTAYAHTNTLSSVVDSLLRLEYNNYIIYIVADNCDISELSFPDKKIVLLQPAEVLASNTRSHFYAIRHFIRAHERLTIIDSDNLVAPGYLKELDQYFDAGFIAVQGERKAKNLDTRYACLDAARDIYYHFYDGKILSGIGSSATLAGSGMAFTVALYRDCLEKLAVSGAGFDKVLQKEIVTRGTRIAFAEKAVVYDEKTSRTDQLVKQRARWINTWFRYFSFGFGLMAKGIGGMNRNQFFFGLVLLRPPLFLFLLGSVACLALNLLLGNSTAVMYWITGVLLFIAGFGIALAASHTDKRVYRSLWNIPSFVFYQVLSLLKVRKANQHSVATQHYHDQSTG